MHLDVVADDLHATLGQVQQRGGELVSGPHSWDLPGSEPFHWCVMHDPESNEFCLIEHRPDVQVIG